MSWEVLADTLVCQEPLVHLPGLWPGLSGFWTCPVMIRNTLLTLGSWHLSSNDLEMFKCQRSLERLRLKVQVPGLGCSPSHPCWLQPESSCLPLPPHLLMTLYFLWADPVTRLQEHLLQKGPKQARARGGGSWKANAGKARSSHGLLSMAGCSCVLSNGGCLEE